MSGAFSACATEADIARWEAAGRDDILAWVNPIAVGDTFVYDIWINPNTDDDVSQCPWLERDPVTDRYACGIHDLKPDHCRLYPRSREHADETGCPGYGPQDSTPPSCQRGRTADCRDIVSLRGQPRM